MNTKEIIKKQLTMREYRGYLKGTILELQLNIGPHLTATEIENQLNIIKSYERELNKYTGQYS